MLTAAHLLIHLNIPLSSSATCQPSGPSLTWIPLAGDWVAYQSFKDGYPETTAPRYTEQSHHAAHSRW